MMPRVWVVLRLDLTMIGVGDGCNLRARVEMLGEAGNAGIGVGRDGGIVLIEVLEREGVLLGGVVIEVGHGNIGVKAALSRE
jgi:hypothetical protein